MRTTRFQRITAFLLAALMCIGSVVTIGAASYEQNTNSELNSIRELLNAISYNEYQELDEFKDAVYVDEDADVTINGLDGVYSNAAGAVEDYRTAEEIEAIEEALAQLREECTDSKKGFDQKKFDELKKEIPGYDYIEHPFEFKDESKEEGEEDSKGLFIPSSGTVTWTTDQIEESSKYTFQIRYYPYKNKAATIERIFLINGKVPFAEARYLKISKVWTTPFPIAEIEPTGDVTAKDIKKEAEKAGFDKKDVTINKKTGKVELVKPDVWTDATAAFVDKYDVRFFISDIDKNEIRESLSDSNPVWQTYTVKDSNGFTQDPFVFVLTPDDNGNVTFSLEGVNEPIVISEIKLVPAPASEDEDSAEIGSFYPTYKEYSKQYKNKKKGDGLIKMESEYFNAVSDQTIYPLSDTTSAATSPAATDRTLLNVIGGEKWQGVGQWVEYSFKVSKSGMYNISLRYKQNILDGMAVSRSLYLFSDSTVPAGEDGYYNGIPFEEAARLKFNFGDNWEIATLSDGEKNFEFYFEKDVTYTVRLEVSLGDMGDIVRRVQEALDSINTDYLNILKLTGTSPDEFRDYGFYRLLPETMGDMLDQYNAIAGVAEPGKECKCGCECEYIKGSIVHDILKDSSKSSMTATLVNVADLLKEMAYDEDSVAKNLERLKTYIGSLGTWLGDAKTQPLLLDYIVVSDPQAQLPEAEANFFQALWHELSGFFQSFFRNYDRMGAMTLNEDAEDNNVEVWLAYGRDQAQVIRNLISNEFDPETTEGEDVTKIEDAKKAAKDSEITVDLKLVAGGTLLPSILSNQGPDVYLGLGAGDVINYAIRGALEAIDDMPEFEDAKSDFNESAMIVLEIECAGKNGDSEDHQKCYTKNDDGTKTVGKKHCYGLPETQGFAMMFVREDILAELNIEIPKTWDDVKEAIPVLQANNMEIAMSTDSNIFIYQMGGELFADGGMRINLDSKLATVAFQTMCDLFTMYSFPYQYNFANRFRTGEMPIGFADYTGTYNHLKVFATEIEGLWSFYPLPGIIDETTGEINNDAVSGVSAVVMVTQNHIADDKEREKAKENAWEFMRWYVGDECQASYSNEMVAILGPSAKHATANTKALEMLPWTRAELEQIRKQFDNLAAIPNYPGAYIIGRYTNFAFLDAYNDNLDPVASLLSYIDYINDEITRKRDEFSLETLDKTKGQSTLAIKRMQQAEEELEEIMDSSKYSSKKYGKVCKNVLNKLDGYTTKDHVMLTSLANDLRELNSSLFKNVASYLDQAAACLKSYEKYN